jgi:hypothetical protein
MLAVRLCRERVLLRLASIGVGRLADRRAGRPLWHPAIAIAALRNLIDAAGQEHTPPARCR